MDMSRLILAVDRVRQAFILIQKARELPVPEAAEGGRYNFTYVAQVKALLQDARDLVKYIPKTPSATNEIKEQVRQIMLEADRANQEILHPSAGEGPREG
jgi:hypothetical protein